MKDRRGAMSSVMRSPGISRGEIIKGLRAAIRSVEERPYDQEKWETCACGHLCYAAYGRNVTEGDVIDGNLPLYNALLRSVMDRNNIPTSHLWPGLILSSDIRRRAGDVGTLGAQFSVETYRSVTLHLFRTALSAEEGWEIADALAGRDGGS